MKRDCAVYEFTTQSGDDKWDRVKTLMECDELTTIGDIQAWAKRKCAVCPICLSIEPLERNPTKECDCG